jgi:transcriptional regulator with XRE-family HTH domain
MQRVAASPKEIAERMRTYREMSGDTQAEFAEKIGAGVRTYSRWEKTADVDENEPANDRASDGFLRRLDAIAAALEIPVEHLTEGVQDELPRAVEEAKEVVGELRAVLAEALEVKAEIDKQVAWMQSVPPPPSPA